MGQTISPPKAEADLGLMKRMKLSLKLYGIRKVLLKKRVKVDGQVLNVNFSLSLRNIEGSMTL